MATLFRIDECASTNDVAMKLALEGAEEGTVVIGERQTKGRGRQGRFWATTPNSIALTYIKRNHLSSEFLSRLTLLAGQAIVESLKRFHIDTQIKWPNDIWLNDGRKVAGILTEASTTGTTIDAVIIGIGINVTRTSTDDSALGFLSDARFDGDKEAVLQSVIESLDTHLSDPGDDDRFRNCLAHHRAHSAVIGKMIATHNASGNPIQSYAVNLDHTGALVVKNVDNTWAIVNSGEVKFPPVSS